MLHKSCTRALCLQVAIRVCTEIDSAHHQCKQLLRTHLCVAVNRSSGFISQPVLAAAPFNWSKVLAGRQQAPQFLYEFAAESTAPEARKRTRPAGAAGLAGLSSRERRERLMSQVSAVITNLLGTGDKLAPCLQLVCTVEPDQAALLTRMLGTLTLLPAHTPQRCLLYPVG